MGLNYKAAQSVTAKAKGAPYPLTTVGLVKLVSRRVVSEVAVLAGTEITGGRGRGRLYLMLHCHHQNDFCIKMGSDESRFNVSLIVRDKVRKTVFINRNF